MLDAAHIPALTVRHAENAADYDDARALASAFKDWLWQSFPAHRPSFEVYFEPTAWAATLRDLPILHARPRGGILLARRGHRSVGCVMYHAAAPGLAQIKRMYVRGEERGRGVGRSLLARLLDDLRADGYARARLDTGTFMAPARALYESAGFRPCASYLDLPPHMAGELVFYDRPL